MKASEIRDLTVDELEKEMVEQKKELLNLKIQARTGQLENHARISHTRKNIARLLTEKNMRNKAS